MNKVTVIGGGLAGMVAALRLAQRGESVELYELSDRLGGKAGANKFGDEYDEHGWHLFPIWYLNTFALADELGFRDNFIDCTTYSYMSERDYPKVRTLTNPFSWKTCLQNLFNGIIPWEHSLLYQYTGLDLMSQSVSKETELDQITLNAFARSRYYNTETVVRQLEDTVSRASAIESFEMSAMSVQNVMRYWYSYNAPWFRILNGDMQTKFISYFERALLANGVKIHKKHKLTKVHFSDGNVSGIRLVNLEKNCEFDRKATNLIVAVPAPNLQSLLDPKFIEASPSSGGVMYLRSRVMAGMTIYLKSAIEEMPVGHVNFVNSPYALSMIDVTNYWNTDKSVIQVIASDYTALSNHDKDAAQAVILADLRRYIPWLSDDIIRRIDFQPHTENPLFANTAGMWERRPVATCEVPNLFFAGDFCRTHVELTCMEGAVTSGLQAAQAVQEKLGLGRPVETLYPKTRSSAYFKIKKWIIWPAAMVALMVVLLKGTRKAPAATKAELNYSDA